jgi:hypothetical protein
MSYIDQRYIVSVKGTALKEGKKLNLPKKDFLHLIRELKKLKYWPDSNVEFDYEEVVGSLELKFFADNRWIRVFVYKDDETKLMNIIYVLAKKTNTLHDSDKKLISSRIRRIEDEKVFNKKKVNSLTTIKGGKSE